MPILAVLAANLAACGDEKMTSKETTSSGNETTSSADDSSPFENDDLPDNLNFGDRFGLTFGDTNKYLGFQMALGGVTALKGKDGYEIFVDDERMINAFDAAYSLVQKTEGVLLPGGNNKDNPLAVEAFGGNYADKTFIEGNALFTMSLAGDAAFLSAVAKRQGVAGKQSAARAADRDSVKFLRQGGIRA